MNVLLLSGGRTHEKRASGHTKNEVVKSLVKQGIIYSACDVCDFFADPLKYICNDTVVFNAGHGSYTEDGNLQGMLNCLSVPYTHSGVFASAMAMDKWACKNIYRLLDVVSPKAWLVQDNNSIDCEAITYPLILKPRYGGSSLGIQLVNNEEELLKAVDKADCDYIAESYIWGNDATVSLINGKAIGLTQYFDEGMIHDEAAKFNPLQRYNFGEDLPEDLKEQIFDASERVYTELECSGIARIDFRIAAADSSMTQGSFSLIEVNTHPGLSPQSSFRRQLDKAGIEFDYVIKQLLLNACYEDPYLR